MVERCTDLAGDEGIPGYVRLVSGFMFPQQDGESYVYKMEASDVGLDGSVNTLKLVDYGDDSTLINWFFEINPLQGASEDNIIDYLGFLYKSCINRKQGALEAVIKSINNEC
ncbi:conserved hypothetical protein [Ricinus communis]|uniref:Bet v I/Major latex protein domain-containing protein n=1 Tax=Ricinus communis TaxID=3988 RepID=B9SWP7_RICCO|nr:conserved hypothetical protein [Ricinus communis]